MADKAQSTDAATTGETPVAPGAAPARRGPGHRGADVRDTVAEMAARAHEISQEAGSKMAAAMKDVINAAAGLAGFAVESARDLVQYMVRRGQMTQEEADRLLREAEAAFAKRKPAPSSSNGDGGAKADGGRAQVASRGEPAPRDGAPAVKRAEPRLADRQEARPAARVEPARPEPRAEAKGGVKSEVRQESKQESKQEAKPAAKSAAKAPASRSAPKVAAKAPAKSVAKAPAKAAAKAPSKSAAKSGAKSAAKKGGTAAKKATAKRK